MTTAGLLFSRLRDSAAILAALALVVVVAAFALTLTLGSVQNGVAEGSRTVLDAAAPQSAAVRIETHLADDSEAQQTAARGMIAKLFPDATVDVHSQQRALPVDLRGAEPASVVFGVQPDLADSVTIEAGTWPADGAAIQADAAEALGLGVGDQFVVGTDAENVAVTVAALWRADDPADPAWFADPTFASGRDGDAFGTVVVDEATLRQLPTQLFTSWTLTATPAALDGDRIGAVTTALRQLNDSVRATPGVVDVSSSTEGALAATLDRIADAARGATAIAASAVVIVGLLAVVAIMQLSSVLVGSRRRQAELIRARGLSLSQLAALAAVEALVVAVPAAVLGVLTAGLAVGRVSPWSLASIAVGTAVATTVCLVAVVLLDARAGAASTSTAPSAVPFITGGTIVAAAAAIATWQLYSGGSANGVDLVGAASPALALVAIAVLGTALLFPVAAAIARTAARSGRVGTVLAARQIARRVTSYLIPALSLAIAVASAAFATGLATTWSSTEHAAHLVGIGSDVAVALPDGGATVTSTEYAGLGDVRGAAALVLATASLGSDTIPFVAVRPRSAQRVLGDDAAEAVKALETTTPDASGLELADGATEITAQVTTEGTGTPTSTFDVAMWAADADGALSRVSLVTGAEGWTAPLPDGVAPWRLISVEVVRTGKPDRAVETITVSNIAGHSSASVEVDVSAEVPRAIEGIEPGPDADLPVVVTDALADRLGIGVGDPLTFEFDPSGDAVDAVVSAITPRLPGSASRLAIGTDLLGFDDVTLRPRGTPVRTNAVWISTEAPQVVAGVIARDATTTAVVSTDASSSSGPVVASALTAFWLAAIAAALLALVAISAFFVDDFRNRRDDIAVLRALGFSSRAQAATRRFELVVTAAFAAVVGAVCGGLTTALVVGPFIASAVPTAAVFVRVLPVFDPLPWLLYCAVFAVAAAAVAVALLARVRRSAASAIVEEGTA